ncbi:MAG: glycosyltransferase family 39 protein, partial [Nanoarchaeota archaeon]
MLWNYKKILIFILVLALILRVASVFISPVKDWDETVYDNLGYDLSVHPFDYSFANNGWSDFIPGGLYPKAGFRPPLLPYMIALFYFLNLGFFVQFIMPLIGTLAVLLVYLLGKNLFDEKTGLIAAAFLSVMPLHIIMSGRIMNDVLSTALILLSFLIFWIGYERDNKRAKVVFGFVFALALLARYTTLWLLPVFLFYFIIRYKSLRFLKDRYLWLAAALFILTLSPWLIYGFVTYNNPIGAFVHGGIAASYWGGNQPTHFFFARAFDNFSFIAFVFLFSLVYIFIKRLYRYNQ